MPLDLKINTMISMLKMLIRTQKKENQKECVRCKIEYVKPGETVLARMSFNLPEHDCDKSNNK